MTISKTCPPHQWDENGAVAGIVLAKCLKCTAKQWHATDGSFDSLKGANKRNEKDGLEIISFQKRRYMDTTFKNDNSDVANIAQSNTPTAKVPKHVDSRIQRMRDNRGNSERFDKLAPQVLEDVKTMTWNAALRKAGIPIGSAGRLRRRWQVMGIINASTPPNDSLPTPEIVKSEGQLFYEAHAQEVGLKSPWNALSHKAKEVYERKATEPPPDKPKAKHLGRTFRDYEKEKDSIIADYQKLTLKEFYAKQHLWSGTWTELKRKWNISAKYAVKPSTMPETQPDADKLTEVIKRLADIDVKLVALDQAVSEILNIGYMDMELKIDIVSAYLLSTSSGANSQDRAKKVIEIVEAIDNV